MRRAVIYILIFGIFCMVVGIGIGFISVKRYAKDHFPEMIRAYLVKQTAPEGRQARKNEIIQRLGRELNLSAGQKDQIRAILGQAQSEIKAERDKIREASRRIRESTNNQIAQVLDSAQKEKFQLLADKARKNALENIGGSDESR